MWICEICSTKVDKGLVCPECGFDCSTDTEKYPAFGEYRMGDLSKKGLIRKREENSCGKKYNEALAAMTSAATPDEYFAAAKLFAALGNYNGSNGLAEHCNKLGREKLDAINEQQKAEARRREEERRRQQEAETKRLEEERRKKEAEAKRAEAQRLAEELKQEQLRKEAEQMRLEKQAAYGRADNARLHAHSYEEYFAAAEMFEKLGQFDDSRQKAGDCRAIGREIKRRYDIAMDAMKSASTPEQFIAAAEAFEALRDDESMKLAGQCRAYAKKLEEQSPMVKAARYLKACELRDKAKTAEDFENAAKAFEALGTHSDSSNQAWKCRQRAEKLRGKKGKKVKVINYKLENVIAFLTAAFAAFAYFLYSDAEIPALIIPLTASIVLIIAKLIVRKNPQAGSVAGIIAGIGGFISGMMFMIGVLLFLPEDIFDSTLLLLTFIALVYIGAVRICKAFYRAVDGTKPKTK